MPRRRDLLPALPLLALPLLARPIAARAEAAWPARPVRIIVPYPPGGNSDVVVRMLASRLSPALGQPVVVENRPGGATNLGAEAAARSAPDGYTLFLGSVASHGINPQVFPRLPYDPVRDFTPVVLLVESPIYLVVSASLPVRSLAELIAYARAHPGELSYGSLGVGTVHHLAMEMLKQRAGGLQIEHVPYRGSAQVVTDLLAGTVQLAWDVTAISQTRDGKLRALAVGGSRRNPSWPEVPAMSELGFPEFDVGGWFGLLGPASMPREVVDRLNAEANAALRDPAVVARYAEVGLRPVGGTPEDLAQYIARELARWRSVAQAARIQLE